MKKLYLVMAILLNISYSGAAQAQPEPPPWMINIMRQEANENPTITPEQQAINNCLAFNRNKIMNNIMQTAAENERIWGAQISFFTYWCTQNPNFNQ
jgi:hypothetical protein